MKRLSAEGKGIRRDAGVEKLDAEGSIRDTVGLAHQLIQTLLSHAATAIGGDVRTVGITGGFSVNQDFEAHRFTIGGRPQHQVQIASVEAVDDATGWRA